jgi:RHS repeat-associated protein
VTGWLKTIQSGASGGTGIQHLAYEWDKVGNLKLRRDVNQSNLTETFTYDNLHRLDYSQLNNVTNLDMAYDAMGNITSKSDVGTYTYHATKKHQVTATSNGWTFGYDANGNMTSGRGANISWTSFNYPLCIRYGSNCSGGSDYSQFSYTPDRQYWKQESNYTSGGTATTIYIDGILEKVATSAGTDYRHMIRAGGSTIIVSRKSTGTNSVHYVTRDHLGSSSAVTNSSGGVLVNSSFDAFGKRRGANWSGSPSGADWTAIAATTRRGYTDHTMLDNVGLVHMNGRLQDPILGRFATADPFISEPGFTQNYNRYSYVYNNPIRFVDPSGFNCEDSDEKPAATDANGDGIPDDGGRQDGSTSAAGAAACMREILVRADPQCNANCMRLVVQLTAQWTSYLATLNLAVQAGLSALPGTAKGGSSSSNDGELQGEGESDCSDALVDIGNWFQDTAKKAGNVSMKLWGTGVVISVHSLTSGNILQRAQELRVGFSTMVVGGIAGEGAALLQAVGGLFHGFGGAGWDNAQNGGAMFLGGQVIKNAFSSRNMPLNTNSDMLRATQMRVAQTAGGGLYDAITSLPAGLEPKEKNCGRPRR